MGHKGNRQIPKSVLKILELQVLQSTLNILILFEGIQRVGKELLQTVRQPCKRNETHLSGLLGSAKY
jgi:hypothetical protein